MEPYRNYTRNCYQRNNPSCDGRRTAPVGNPYIQTPKFEKMKAPLAMAYVHMQEWGALYNPDDALTNGTAFPDLNLIFCGVRGKCHE